MTTIATYLLSQQQTIESKLNELETIISSAPKGAMGLTLDSAKTLEWHNAKKLYNVYWKMFQNINKQLSKQRKPIGREVINGKLTTIYKYKLS